MTTDGTFSDLQANDDVSSENFERLLVRLSSKFISVPIERIDDIIEETQEEICNVLGYDLSSLWQWSEKNRHIMVLTHLFTRPGGPSNPGPIDASQAFPWIYSHMLSGTTLAYSNDELPHEAAVDTASRIFYGVVSSVNIPLATGSDATIGILTFDTISNRHSWHDEEIGRLKLVAEIFANALARKHSEQKLRTSEERLALAADSAGAVLWELDVATELFVTTEGVVPLFGFEPGETISIESFFTRISDCDRQRVRRALSCCLAEGKPLDVEYRFLLPDGSQKWIHSMGRPYSGRGGAAARLLGVSFDITERKKMEFQHLREKARLASAVDIAALGFYEMIENHHIDFIDGRMRDLLGLADGDESEVRRFWLARIHPDDLAYVQTVIRMVLEEGVDRFELTYRYLHPRRGLSWLHHLSRVSARDGEGRATRVIGVMRDITEAKSAEEKLRRSETALKHKQRDLQKLAGRLIAVKEEELRRLSRELHDDLTQRLAVIAIDAGKLELEMKDGGTEPETACARVVALKEQLIQLSGDVHRISRQLHPTILDDLGLQRAIESECDAVRLRDGLAVNLLMNHIREPIPTPVSLCVYRVIQEALTNITRHAAVNQCEVRLSADEGSMYLSVADRGAGFDPLQVRNKPGLGLSSMRERVQFVNGDFSIVSTPLKGTTIRARIPLGEQAS